MEQDCMLVFILCADNSQNIFQMNTMTFPLFPLGFWESHWMLCFNFEGLQCVTRALLLVQTLSMINIYNNLATTEK